MAKDTRLEELEALVKDINTNGATPDKIYDLVLMGHRVYKQGLGLPHSHVYAAIERGFILTKES